MNKFPYGTRVAVPYYNKVWLGTIKYMNLSSTNGIHYLIQYDNNPEQTTYVSEKRLLTEAVILCSK